MIFTYITQEQEEDLVLQKINLQTLRYNRHFQTGRRWYLCASFKVGFLRSDKFHITR